MNKVNVVVRTAPDEVTESRYLLLCFTYVGDLDNLHKVATDKVNERYEKIYDLGDLDITTFYYEEITDSKE